MKVLILSITAGQGHHQTADAIADHLRGRGAECRTLDAFEYINPLLSESVSKGYLMSTQYSKAVYSNFYRLAERKEQPSGRNSISRIATNLLSKKLVTYIGKYRPDVIVCTHIFAAQMITEARNLIKAKTIGIVTDFTLHPYWEDTLLDYYVTATPLINNQFRKKGIPEDKILPIGIPIKDRFASSLPKSEARAQLGIPDKNTILFMGGSMGYGSIAKYIERLEGLRSDFQILCVCGNNKRMKKRIDSMSISRELYSFGYIDNVDLLMDASDCICTKPGGLTTSEALAKGLPIIITAVIPGQEERNREFLMNNGLAMSISATYPIDECIYQFYNNHVRRSMAEQMASYVGRPNATRDLGEFIFDLQKD